MVIAITGVTGLLGRNILFEFLKENRDRLDRLTVLIFGRPRGDLPLAERVRRMVMTDGLAYLGADETLTREVARFCDAGIRCIDASLDRPGLGITPRDLATLSETPIDLFFHAAALTDLRQGRAVTETLERVNVRGTAETLRLAAALKPKEFCHISTAYVCGKRKGVVAPDDLDPDGEFRNPYETSKARAELLVRKFAAETGSRCRFFRPSILCGRIMEEPAGAVVKFEMFYAWTAFFYAVKLRRIRSYADRYAEQTVLDMRIAYDLAGGLNIVPADYAAKAICRISGSGHPAGHYHLTNPYDTPTDLCARTAMASLGISGVRHAEEVPERQNGLERLYYRSAGAVFTPYMTGGSPRFDTHTTEDALRGKGLACPRIGRTEYAGLLDYAKRYDFGLARSIRRATAYPTTVSRPGSRAHATSLTAG